MADIQAEIMALRPGPGRVQSALSAELSQVRMSVRVFQNQRLADTYQDLLCDPETGKAASFFLDYLYGTKNLEKRDQQAYRVLPKVDKYLPSKAVSVLEGILEMDLLAERMDMGLAEQLLASGFDGQSNLTPVAYLKAFRAMGQRSVRERQIALIPGIGGDLAKLLRFPMLAGVLKMTRGAAQNAGLEDFHEFLLSGVQCFKSLKSPSSFFAIIVNRETELLELIFDAGINDFPKSKNKNR
ncbi:MAG: hypothetical protein R3194_02750 [Limnobacter sp.]|nr:hypothetical protein [Limnobacter sp.]